MKKEISQIETPVNRTEEVLYQILIRLDEISSKLTVPVTTTKKKVVKKNDTRKTSVENKTQCK